MMLHVANSLGELRISLSNLDVYQVREMQRYIETSLEAGKPVSFSSDEGVTILGAETARCSVFAFRETADTPA